MHKLGCFFLLNLKNSFYILDTRSLYICFTNVSSKIYFFIRTLRLGTTVYNAKSLHAMPNANDSARLFALLDPRVTHLLPLTSLTPSIHCQRTFLFRGHHCPSPGICLYLF